MEERTLTIYGEMTSLNEYTNANRSHKYQGAQLKKEETERVAWECKLQKLPHYALPVSLSITIQLDNMRKDQDNTLVWIKYILDGMKEAGVITNDSPRYVQISHIGFVYGKNTKTIVTISPLHAIIKTP